jgi:hypothetical protein
MHMTFLMPDKSMSTGARANEICEEIQAVEEETTKVETDAAFELAFRIIVMKSLPAWIDEICSERF